MLTRMFISIPCVTVTLFATVVAAVPLAIAAEGPGCAGETMADWTVIDRDNLDTVKGKCFHGHRVGDLIPDRMAWMIRDQDFSIKAAPPATHPQPYRLQQATEKFKGQASVDPNTKQLLNYTAGIPFPDIDPNDPLAAYKVHYSHWYARGGDHWGNSSPTPNFAFTLIEASSGIERIQMWNYSGYKMINRVTATDGRYIEGDGKVWFKALLYATYPHDIRGLGTFTIRYPDGAFDDVWAYIRTVRRVRRLSGAAWFDPIGGTDQLQDDFGLWGHPTWYTSLRFLGKVHVFGIEETSADKPEGPERFPFQNKGKTIAEQFPRLKPTAPYWNVEDTWQPTTAYVIEVTPPAQHPYGRRVIHFSVHSLGNVFSEAFDKKGDFWKVIYDGDGCYVTQDEFIDPNTGKPECVWFEQYGLVADYQRRHATIYWVGDDLPMQPPSMQSDDFSYSVLEAAGR